MWWQIVRKLLELVSATNAAHLIIPQQTACRQQVAHTNSLHVLCVATKVTSRGSVQKTKKVLFLREEVA
ncbi:hypothetical protein BIW11_12904, partial [Tropilaelaps mercedesae]